MLTREEDVEITALRKRGWSLSAIARHLGISRNTVRVYARGERSPGRRRPATPDPIQPYVEYIGIRLRDDPHVWGSALYDEVRRLGYDQGYVSFVRKLRVLGLRPVCEACASGRKASTIEIEHPAGEEIQWDWLELEETPWGEPAHLLQGSLPYSGRTRGVFAEGEEQGQLVEAIDGVLRRLGGTARRWRFDRMSTVVNIRSGEVLDSFAAVAKFYGVTLAICPSRRAKRKGVVEKAQHFSAQRWWRTAEVESLYQAQTSYDRFCAGTGDDRPRASRTVRELAEEEGLLALPPEPYPALIEVERTVGPTSLVSYRANRYSVLPGLEGGTVAVRHRVGGRSLEIVSRSGLRLAEHVLAPPGAGVVVRLPDHKVALEHAVLAAFTTAQTCRRKVNRPPSPEAKAAAAKLRDLGERPVAIDLDRYAQLAEVAR
jgi:transposase